MSCPQPIFIPSHLISSLASRLYSSAFYDQHMIPFQPPEIATTSLEDLLLQVRLTDMTYLSHTSALSATL
jgi:HrpA-like RNA helicase